MKRSVLTSIIFLLIFTSCDYVSYRKPKKIEIPSIDTIDYSKLDEYPVFPECDSIPSQDKQRICFQIKMSRYIYLSLNQLLVSSKSELNDTIVVKIIVDNNGKTKLSSIQKSDRINKHIPKIDSIVVAGLDALPLLQPAIKRGIPVSAEFSLPIVLKTD